MLAPFVGVIGLPGESRGAELEKKMSLYTKNLQFGLGELVSLQDFQQERFHTNNLAIPVLGRPLTRGEVGCALGHLRAYKMLIESGASWGLIAEDDAIPVREIDLEKLNKFLSSSSPKVCSLYWELATTPTLEPLLCALSTGVKQKSMGFFRVIFPPTHTVAYAINKAAAEQLVLANKKVSFPSDWPYIGTQGIKFYKTTEKYFEHGSNASKIETIDSSTGFSRSFLSKRESKTKRLLSLFSAYKNVRSREKGPGVLTLTILRPLAFSLLRSFYGRRKDLRN